MADRDENTRLEELDARIQALKPKVVEAPKNDDHYSQVQLGWRMVIELVAGLAIGFGIGYGLDRLFGTLPIFLILFIMLGLAAGIRVMLRTAKELQEDYTPPGGD